MLRAVEFDGSSHRRVIDSRNMILGLFYKTPSGTYFFEPAHNKVFGVDRLVEILNLLIEINDKNNSGSI